MRTGNWLFWYYVELVCSLSIEQLTSLDAFVIGAIAKAVATTVTYPLQTVQSILRVSNIQFQTNCL